MTAGILTALAVATLPVTGAVPVSPEKGSTEESLLKQFKEEAGTEPLPRDQDLMLRQKYGIVPAQLVLSEQNLIRREEHDGGN